MKVYGNEKVREFDKYVCNDLGFDSGIARSYIVSSILNLKKSQI